MLHELQGQVLGHLVYMTLSLEYFIVLSIVIFTFIMEVMWSLN